MDPASVSSHRHLQRKWRKAHRRSAKPEAPISIPPSGCDSFPTICLSGPWTGLDRPRGFHLRVCSPCSSISECSQLLPEASFFKTQFRCMTMKPTLPCPHPPPSSALMPSLGLQCPPVMFIAGYQFPVTLEIPPPQFQESQPLSSSACST